jgi:hypothetical protein
MALCTLSPLHESTGGEVTIDEPDGTRSPPRTDLRPYIDQVYPPTYIWLRLMVVTDCIESQCTYGVGI